MKILKKINGPLFLILTITLIVTFFAGSNYKKVNFIVPAVLEEPVQKEIQVSNPIKFTKDGFLYELTPRAEYEISALIVHKMDYRWFSLSKTDNAIPMDIGLIWGSNVKDRLYKDKSLKFSQDGRFLWAKWSGNLKFNMEECSNNHMVVNRADLEKKLKSLYAGDQIYIKGKLVDIKAIYNSEEKNPKNLTLATSTARNDTGAGACEIIYPEDIIILKKANTFYRFLFQISFYGLILLIILNTISFFKSINNPDTFKQE